MKSFWDNDKLCCWLSNKREFELEATMNRKNQIRLLSLFFVLFLFIGCHGTKITIGNDRHPDHPVTYKNEAHSLFSL